MKTVLTVVTIILPFICIAQKPQPGWDEDPLLGNVKRIRTSVCTLASKKELGLEPYGTKKIQPIDTTWFLVDGSSPSQYKIVLYENEAELTTRPFDTNWYKVDSFDKTGHEVVLYKIKKGTRDVFLRYGYRFDVRGNMIEENYTDDKTGVTQRRTFNYNTTGHITEQRLNDPDGSFGRLITYSYSSGVLIKEDDSISQGTTETSYKYNNKGKLIEETTCAYHNDNQKLTIKYTYDDKGNKVSETWKSRSATIISRFDEHGNIIGYGNDDTVAIQYMYDSQGNWIRRIQQIPTESTTMDEPIKLHVVIIREIEYY